MTEENRGNAGFGAGLPEFLILKLLQQREMYGYEIVRSIASATHQAITPGEGVVYPLLRALEKDGDLKSRTEPAGGRTRVYYALTAKGVRRLFDQTDQWTRIVRAVQQALRPG